MVAFLARTLVSRYGGDKKIPVHAERIAHVNNLREKQFGVSPRDRQALNASVLGVLRRARVVHVAKAALLLS